MPKRTYNPSKIRTKRRHGFRKKALNAKGKKTLKRRRLKGRKKLTS
jgi:large subunit ribosomal protein L34